MKSAKFKKGDKIIENGVVYAIFKIETVKTDDGEEKIIHYKPYFNSNSSYSSLTCSIPEKNIALSNIRKPVSISRLNEVITYLSKGKKDDTEASLLKTNERFRLNNVYETVNIIKQCIDKQITTEEDFNFEKNGVLSDAVEMLLEEVALVYKISIKDAMKKLRTAAKTYYSVAK